MALKISVLGSGSVRLNVSSFKWKVEAFLRETTVAAAYCHKEKTFDRHFEGRLVCLVCDEGFCDEGFCDDVFVMKFFVIRVYVMRVLCDEGFCNEGFCGEGFL